MTDLRVMLAAIEPPLADACERFCGDLDFVTVHRGSILELDADAVVSPANSYGFMDGGIDALYLDHFGVEIQLRVRRQIYDQHGGELLVGTADIVETGDDRIPFLIAAPTMRVPMVLQNSPNAYLAARAVFRLDKQGVIAAGPYAGERRGDRVRSVALPGLGTGVGRIGFDTCARQVRAAIDDILLGRFEMPKSWAEASERHQLLYRSYPVRLQY